MTATLPDPGNGGTEEQFSEADTALLMVPERLFKKYTEETMAAARAVLGPVRLMTTAVMVFTVLEAMQLACLIWLTVRFGP